ncbi:Calcium/calmodulin-dependent 3',5'-cyclic nucleotide phosphodiesterase 1C [Liparis tanakae]|uniref:Calcium/calmodulin-dependent 3',5'-cyclic nucleotide phosphodiesterase 1C n=1 Tax=Liparis tanakae TaxID=230148 RepID=A0A4Z2IM51_9TELE|nr:Calcium/calmodulin-dependent 3',5'-cyclic nucleotide phosphodiesterase 1C [Liparis tanakae]
MESPTKEIEEFESTALKYLQPEQIEKIWLRLRGLRKYKKTSQRACSLNIVRCLFTVDTNKVLLEEINTFTQEFSMKIREEEEEEEEEEETLPRAPDSLKKRASLELQ